MRFWFEIKLILWCLRDEICFNEIYVGIVSVDTSSFLDVFLFLQFAI